MALVILLITVFALVIELNLIVLNVFPIDMDLLVLLALLVFMELAIVDKMVMEHVNVKQDGVEPFAIFQIVI